MNVVGSQVGEAALSCVTVYVTPSMEMSVPPSCMARVDGSFIRAPLYAFIHVPVLIHVNSDAIFTEVREPALISIPVVQLSM